MDPSEIDTRSAGRLGWPGPSRKLNQIQGYLLMAVAEPVRRSSTSCLPQSRSAAALAFYDLVALLEQALALAIFALPLLLDVGPFFVGHEDLQALMRNAIHGHSTNERCR